MAQANSENKRPVVCVFCGASAGKSPVYMEAARSLGHALHHHNAKLVYGGGDCGLMGEVAKTLVSLSGADSVHGIIPKPLIQWEAPSRTEGNSEQKAKPKSLPDPQIFGRSTVVDDMHQRKRMMANEVQAGGPGSGFIALPGGYGTLEEITEMSTWNQLGIHKEALVLFNVNDYWTDLLKWMRNANGAGFISDANLHILQSADNADDVIKAIREYVPSKGRLNLNWGAI